MTLKDIKLDSRLGRLIEPVGKILTMLESDGFALDEIKRVGWAVYVIAEDEKRRINGTSIETVTHCPRCKEKHNGEVGHYSYLEYCYCEHCDFTFHSLYGDAIPPNFEKRVEAFASQLLREYRQEVADQIQ